MIPNYSIIIPHKDIPDLLQRCLDSIPLRDDIEVIVVDDNSDSRNVDFSNFPQWEGKQYLYFLTKESKGPGYARNVGLDHAKGRWIVFADADDFFAEGFNALLDDMKDAMEDVVFFDYINVLSDSIETEVNDRTWFRKLLFQYLNGDKSEKRLRTDFPVSWSKIINRTLIERHHIRFGEIKWSEDVCFSALVGYHAQSIRVTDRIGYTVTTREGSITHDFCATAKEFRMRLAEEMKVDDLFKERYGPNVRTKNWLRYICRIKGYRRCQWYCIANMFHPRVFRRMVRFFCKEAIKEKAN